MKAGVSAIVALLLMLVATKANAQETDARERFARELAERGGALKTIRCKFTQERVHAALSRAAVKEGDFYLSMPNDILLSFSDGDYIKMSALWVEMQTVGKVSRAKVSSNPMLRSLRTLLTACIAGDFDPIAKGFNVSIDEGEREWHVKLTPQRGKAGIKVSSIALNFSKEDLSLNLLKIEEGAGNYLQYEFTDKQFNTEVEASLFKAMR